MTDWADTLWHDLLEKDDRTSPAEYPDMALVTKDEFIAALREARAMGPEWQDISTAAIDGHRQLLSGPYHDGSIRGWTAIGSWSTREDGWVDDTQRRFDPQPTHWQPLPAPPKES